MCHKERDWSFLHSRVFFMTIIKFLQVSLVERESPLIVTVPQINNTQENNVILWCYWFCYFRLLYFFEALRPIKININIFPKMFLKLFFTTQKLEGQHQFQFICIHKWKKPTIPKVKMTVITDDYICKTFGYLLTI